MSIHERGWKIPFSSKLPFGNKAVEVEIKKGKKKSLKGNLQMKITYITLSRYQKGYYVVKKGELGMQI